jgi:hypothetical protein
MLSLTGCRTEYVYAYPPEGPLQPCPIDYGKRTGEDVTRGLVAGIECERAGKAETLGWIRGHKSATP